MSYIYRITNNVTGMSYVGNTSYDIQKRWREHCHDAKKARCQNRPLYADMQEYGFENFSISVIEKCNDEIANEREKYWIKKLDTFKNGYNCTFGGSGKANIDHDLLIKTYFQTRCIKETAAMLGISIDTVSDVISATNVEKPSYHEIAYMRGKTKPVKVISDDGSIMKAFDSVRKAAEWIMSERCELKSLKAAMLNISRVCKSKSGKAYGFTWKFEDIA